MSTAHEIAKAMNAPGAAARPAAPLAPAQAPALARRLAGSLGATWLPRAAWTVGRTGRVGLLGIALLLAAALFFGSTYLQVSAEVDTLRADVAAARSRPPPPAADEEARPAAALQALPARADIPAVLRQLFGKAAQAGLAVDVARYELGGTKSGGVARYQVAFAVTGPYPQVREFLDSTLETMPAVSISSLALERKSIHDGNVEAQLRMTVYARSAP
jgi:hypothetical protein